MITVLYILLALCILLFMVLVHEFGHYIAGRILKFKITEFSVGFGKAIFSRTNKRGEKISLRIIPLGGYCAFEGEDEDNNSPTAFNNQKPWKRIIVLLAGVVANFICAILFSWILLSTIGYDVMDIKKVDSSISSSYSNDFQEGDTILEINGDEIDFAFGKSYTVAVSELKEEAKEFYENEKNDGKSFQFDMKLKRDGKKIDVKATMYEIVSTDEDGESTTNYLIGITVDRHVYSFFGGFARAFEVAFGFAWVVLKSLWQLITFQLPIKDIGGPVTTISTIAEYTKINFANILILIPLISANLAIFNLLPFPALDGSKTLFTTIEWIRRKPINRNVEAIIHFVGLIILFTFVIIVDILHFVL